MSAVHGNDKISSNGSGKLVLYCIKDRGITRTLCRPEIQKLPWPPCVRSTSRQDLCRSLFCLDSSILQPHWHLKYCTVHMQQPWSFSYSNYATNKFGTTLIEGYSSWEALYCVITLKMRRRLFKLNWSGLRTNVMYLSCHLKLNKDMGLIHDSAWKMLMPYSIWTDNEQSCTSNTHSIPKVFRLLFQSLSRMW